MTNPFRSEAEAYRFVVGTLVFFGVIALATALGGHWWGLGVFVVASAVAAWLVFRRSEKQARPAVVPTQGAGDDRKRVLVVANETVTGAKLRDCIRAETASQDASVLVVTPA